MPEYEAQLTLREARRRYFETNGFPPDGGYQEAWVKLSVGPIPVVFPNTKGRQRAVPFHDLHHVVTGYDTSLVGEAEIGGWELATGCVSVPSALILNLLVIWPVLFFAPGAVYRAFVRGRSLLSSVGRARELPRSGLRMPGTSGALRRSRSRLPRGLERPPRSRPARCERA